MVGSPVQETWPHFSATIQKAIGKRIYGYKQTKSLKPFRGRDEDGKGNTLYLFTKDTKGTSNCYDKCEVAWPPLLTLGQPTLGDGVASDLISTTLRKDGTV